MKKILLFLLVFSVGLLFISCDQTNEVEIESEEQLFTLQALSSTTLLSYNQYNVEETSYLPLAGKGDIPDPRITAEVENVDYYVEMMELFLGDDNLTVVSETSDNELYEFMTTYTTLNINGEEVTYVFYYNEFTLDEEQNIETSTYSDNEEATQQRRFYFEDNDDNLVAMGLEGILIFGDLTYNIEGKKIVNDQKEIYRLRSFIDEDNYVMVNYQNDTSDRDKEKFFFKVVEEGVTVNESKVMIFNRDNRLHVKLEFTEGESYSNYVFNIRTEENISFIHINYEIRNGEDVEKGVVRLTAETDPETGDVIYSYSMTPNRSNNQYKNSFRHRHQFDEQSEVQNQ